MEANALIDIVKDVYFPFLNEKSIENIRPGQIVVQAIDLNEPAGKPIKECKFKSVMSKQEITIVTGMKSHLIDEYLKIIKELNA